MLFKIATWNVNSIKIRLPHVIQWLTQNPVDVLALQETKAIDENFPAQALRDIGYHALYLGEKTYNGVALLTRQPSTIALHELPNMNDPAKRVLGSVLSHDLFILNLYVPNGSSIDSDKYAYKLSWLTHLRNVVSELLKKYPRLVLLGDFNIAPTDEDVHDPNAWQGNVLVSDKERQHFQALLQLGLHDSFRLFPRNEAHYSWWDYRMHAFRRNLGLRIDHILISDTLKDKCVACDIDKAPRRWERPSDHVPVVITLDLAAGN